MHIQTEVSATNPTAWPQTGKKVQDVLKFVYRCQNTETRIIVKGRKKTNKCLACPINCCNNITWTHICYCNKAPPPSRCLWFCLSGIFRQGSQTGCVRQEKKEWSKCFYWADVGCNLVAVMNSYRRMKVMNVWHVLVWWEIYSVWKNSAICTFFYPVKICIP